MRPTAAGDYHRAGPNSAARNTSAALREAHLRHTEGAAAKPSTSRRSSELDGGLRRCPRKGRKRRAREARCSDSGDGRYLPGVTLPNGELVVACGPWARGTRRSEPVWELAIASSAVAQHGPGQVLTITASSRPSGENAPPRAKPFGRGLCRVMLDRVAVFVAWIVQLIRSLQRDGIQAMRLEPTPGGRDRADGPEVGAGHCLPDHGHRAEDSRPRSCPCGGWPAHQRIGRQSRRRPGPAWPRRTSLWVPSGQAPGPLPESGISITDSPGPGDEYVPAIGGGEHRHPIPETYG